MMASLPLVAPRDSHALWYTRSSTFSLASSSQTDHGLEPSYNPHNTQGLGPQHLQQQHHQNQRARNAGISPLAQLALDEQSVAQRKLNIQRFGATWIRPPGMAKTYQGELDDRLEREEVQRDMMEDLDVAGEGTFELDDADLDQTEQDLDAESGEEEEESDLDDDIPEGDSYAHLEEEDDEEAEVDLDADVPEAEEEPLWDDSDEDDEDDEEDDSDEEDDDREEPGAYGSNVPATPIMASTRDNSASFATDESPQQAMFSHDESYPDEPRNIRNEGYGWRARARGRRPLNDNSMDVDSDD